MGSVSLAYRTQHWTLLNLLKSKLTWFLVALLVVQTSLQEAGCAWQLAQHGSCYHSWNWTLSQGGHIHWFYHLLHSLVTAFGDGGDTAAAVAAVVVHLSAAEALG
jgi:hypothetical protein